MRLIDLGHYWAASTLRKTVSHLRQFTAFQHSFGIPFTASLPAAPPVNLSIPLFWCMEHKSIQPSQRAKHAFVSFGTLRGIRSALSGYTALESAIFRPSRMFRDDHQRLLGVDFVSPTDNLASQLAARGLAARLGTVVTPSKTIHATHIAWNQRYRVRRLSTEPGLSLVQRYFLIAGQVAELFGYLGWLRSGECFTLKREDLILYYPADAAANNLPPGLGAVLLQLLPETKSSRTVEADVVLSWRTSSGLLLGQWVCLLLSTLDQLGFHSPSALLFRDPVSLRPWTSYFYRHQLLFPLLRLQRSAGDAYLSRFDGSPGNTFADNFTMFHLFRRSGRSHCRRHRVNCLRAATPLEVYLHGRWRFRNTGREAVDLHYVEPTLEDRIYITLLCF